MIPTDCSVCWYHRLLLLSNNTQSPENSHMFTSFWFSKWWIHWGETVSFTFFTISPESHPTKTKKVKEKKRCIIEHCRIPGHSKTLLKNSAYVAKQLQRDLYKEVPIWLCGDMKYKDSYLFRWVALVSTTFQHFHFNGSMLPLLLSTYNNEMVWNSGLIIGEEVPRCTCSHYKRMGGGGLDELVFEL